jgi:hypothetical protein
MARVFDFRCVDGHVSEVFVTDHETRTVACPVCGHPATRLVAAPRAKLEGITGAFPGAADAWERKRNEHMAKEQRVMRDHGTYLNGRPCND